MLLDVIAKKNGLSIRAIAHAFFFPQVLVVLNRLLIRILIRISIIDIIILAVIKVLFSVVIVVRLLRVGRSSRPVVFFVHGIRLILVCVFFVLVAVFIAFFFGAGFGFVGAQLLGSDEALDLGFGVYFGDAQGAALFGGGTVGAGAVYVESWAELGREEVDDCGFCQVLLL